MTNTTNFELKKDINYLYRNFYKFRTPQDRVNYIKKITKKSSIYVANSLRDDKIYTTYTLQPDSITEL